MNYWIKLFNSALLGPLTSISSTYINIIMSDSLVLLKNNEESFLEFLNPHYRRHPLIFSNQALGACLRSYNALCNLQTWLRLLLSTKPSSCCINTSSNNSPFENALLSSTCLVVYWFITVRLRTTLTVVGFTTRLKVSK